MTATLEMTPEEVEEQRQHLSDGLGLEDYDKLVDKLLGKRVVRIETEVRRVHSSQTNRRLVLITEDGDSVYLSSLYEDGFNTYLPYVELP